MATRLKTVHYAFPVLTVLPEDTLTNLTQITIYLPETGTKTFISAVAKASMIDLAISGLNSIGSKRIDLRLGAAAYTTLTNTNLHDTSNEPINLSIEQNFVAHFNANWTGTSMTCDVALLINQSSITTGFNNVCVTLEITYEYDDTSTTQVKTVFIPLNTTLGAMNTTATTVDTIPALDTYLPEASKVYRNIHIVNQGLTNTAATTDFTMTLAVGAATITTEIFESALEGNSYFRYVWELTSAYPSTASTQNWQPVSSLAARFHHIQSYMVVTYEYNESTSTDFMNSLMIAGSFVTPLDGTSSTDFMTLTTDLWIQEPATISTESLAFYLFYTKRATLSGISLRIGTGSFSSYTDNASTQNVCGTDALMIRNDSAFTLVRGKNSITLDVYRSDSVDVVHAASGFWIINYTSGKAFEGSGSHNKTVSLPLYKTGTSTPILPNGTKLGDFSPNIPETDYFINDVSFLMDYFPSHPLHLIPTTGLYFEIEYDATEYNGKRYEQLLATTIRGNDELGEYKFMSSISRFFNRWNGDTELSKLDLQTARNYRMTTIVFSFSTGVFVNVDMLVTYHTIKSIVADSITGFTGTVTLDLHRDDTGEKVLTTTRSGDGAFSFNWYDNTEEMYVVANDGTNVGRSQSTLAVLDS